MSLNPYSQPVIIPGVVLRVFGKRAKIVAREQGAGVGGKPLFWLKALEDTTIRTVALRAGAIYRVCAATVYMSPKLSAIRKRAGTGGRPSQYTGVRWLKRIGKWVAYGFRNGKPVYLGLYIDEHDAGRVANKFREEKAEAENIEMWND